MKTKKQKGFTLVELVIVIAVIAILAAVLIPTFSNLVKKANVSADEQAVRQMNTALAIYTAENGKPESAAEVKIGLSENNINTDTMTPVTKGYAFYWNPSENKIVLVNSSKKAEASWTLLTTNGYGTEKSVSNESDLKEAINASTTDMPALITLTSDIEITEMVTIANGKSAIVDLNNKTIKVNDSTTSYNLNFYVANGGTLKIKNGNIVSNNTSKQIFGNNGGTLVIDGVNITHSDDAADGKKAIIFVGGICDTSIINCNIESKTYYGITADSTKVESDGARILIENSTIKATRIDKDENNKITDGATAIYIGISASLTIINSNFEGAKQGAIFRGCNATIKNSSFSHSIINDIDDGNSNYNWGSGNNGKICDIVFACGGTTSFNGYITSGNYTCENVTAESIYIHEPAGGKVTVTGIDSSKITKETD